MGLTGAAEEDLRRRTGSAVVRGAIALTALLAQIAPASPSHAQDHATKSVAPLPFGGSNFVDGVQLETPGPRLVLRVPPDPEEIVVVGERRQSREITPTRAERAERRIAQGRCVLAAQSALDTDPMRAELDAPSDVCRD